MHRLCPSLTRGRLKLDVEWATLALCSDSVFYGEWFAVLRAIARYELEDSTLILRVGGESADALHFVRTDSL